MFNVIENRSLEILDPGARIRVFGQSIYVIFDFLLRGFLMLQALKKSIDDISNMKNFNIMIDDINKIL